MSFLSVAWSADVTRDAKLEDYLRRFERSYRGVRTLRAKFTETHTWGPRSRSESGTVYLARGGRMRWDYLQPIEKYFVSDGKHLTLYVPAERQLMRSDVKSSGDIRTPFGLLLSRLNLRRMFARVEFAEGNPPQAPENRVLRALPKRGEDDGYREVFIELTPRFDIRRLEISFPDDSRMEFEFSEVERNASLSPSLFRIKVPEGTEVIER